MKRYDRDYFTRWYHRPGTRVIAAEGLQRKVQLAVSAAEFMLGRPIRSALDVGCGEAAWFGVLRRLRPGIRYVGVDSSDYVLRKFGARRRIRRGTLGGLRSLGFRRPFDLVICADVLQYVSDTDARRGLAEIRRIVRGVAYVEAFTAEDDMEGDDEGWHNRTSAQYRRMFRAARLTHCGFHCYVDLEKLGNVNVFETGSAPSSRNRAGG